MDEATFEHFVGQLVTVTLDSGQTLTGTLERSGLKSPDFWLLQTDGARSGFDWTDAIDIQSAHPAEVQSLKEQCTCVRSEDLAVEHESSLRCPVHGPDIEPIVDYAEWRDVFFAVLRENHPSDAGDSLDDAGEYANAGFQVSAAYKPEGDAHGILLVITIKNGIGRGKRQTLKRNWRSDEPGQVALEAIAAYSDLHGRGIA
jgi:hypothetical protein